MTAKLIKGQRVTITKQNDLKRFQFDIAFSKASNQKQDLDMFCLTRVDSGPIKSENIIFYAHPENSNQSITLLQSDDVYNSTKSLSINFNTIPPEVKTLQLMIKIFDRYKTKTLNNTLTYALKITNLDLNTVEYTYEKDINLNTTCSIYLGQIYQYKDLWKYFHLDNPSSSNLFTAIQSIQNS